MHLARGRLRGKSVGAHFIKGSSKSQVRAWRCRQQNLTDEGRAQGNERGRTCSNQAPGGQHEAVCGCEA